MHNNFIDKNRRYVGLRQAQVKGTLPEHFATSYPKFVSLLEKYYDFQTENKGNELTTHLFASRDINETDINLLSYIEDELLLGDAYFEGFGQTEAELRAAANFSSILFRSKGTKFAIEWFFRSFYGLSAEVVYPKEQIFNIGDNDSRIGPESQHFITDDKLYQTYALLVKVGIPVSKWKDVFKLFTHPAGMYLAGEVLLTDEYIMRFLSAQSEFAQYITPSYGLAITPSNNEDEGTTFNGTLTGTNVSNNTGGVFWHIEHVTTTDSDFGYTVADSLNPNYLSLDSSTINTCVGNFTIPTTVDELEGESAETFNLIMRDDQGRTVATSTITLQNVVAQYTLYPKLSPLDSAGAAVYPGLTEAIDSDVPFHYWQVDEVSGATTLVDRVGNANLTVTSPGKLDVTSSRADGAGTAIEQSHNSSSSVIYQSTGATSIMNLTQDFTITWAMRNDANYGGNQTHYIFEKYQTGGNNSEYQFYIQCVSGFPTEVNYAIKQSNGTSRFGTLVTDLQSHGWSSNNQWRWYSLKMDHSGSGELTLKMNNQKIGTVNVSTWSGSWQNNSNTQFGSQFEALDGGLDEIAFFQNALDSDAETRLYNKWTSIPAAPPFTANEGQKVLFDVNSTNAPNNGNITLDWYVQHQTTNDSDFLSVGSPPLTGSPGQVSLVDGFGQFELRSRVDNKVDNNEQYKVFIRTPNDAVVRDSATVTLIDLAPTFTATVPDVVEGNTITATLQCDSTAIGETVFWQMSGAAFSDVRPAFKNGSFVLTGVNDTYNLAGTSTTPQFDEVSGTITFNNYKYNPILTTNDTFTILNLDPVYTITPSQETATEGDTVTFDIGGTNIPDGTVYYRIEHVTTSDSDFSVVPPDSDSKAPINMSGGVSSPSPTLTFVVN